MDNNKSLEELKQELVSEIERRVEDKIIEQANADLLKKLINQAETETEAMDIAALGTTYKRTGFHFDKRLERISNSIKYKTKNERLSFVNDASHPTHQLIIGDNYDALQNLLITHKNSIDVIYIDPPYGKDNMGDFAQTNYENSITRDNLLSMLYPRLLMAKRLLTPEGVIFCSIDDKNQAYVKCLFDEVFGEENFVANLIWKSKSGGANDSKFFAIDHEYVLAFVKNVNSFALGIDKNAKVTTSYNQKDEFGEYALDRLDKQSIRYSSSLDYEIIGPDGKSYVPAHKDPSNPNATWRWGRDTIKERYSELVFKYPFIYTKNYKKDGAIARSLLTDERFGRTRTGKTDLFSIFNRELFSNPKPGSLIKHLISLQPNQNSTILDFFAGSGTTGQAVMELNREDDGNRTFILCTNNEITELNPNGIAYDVTAKRLKRMMSGKCYDGTNNFPWLKSNKPYMDNLNVYEIAEVSKTEHKEGKTAFDKIDETCYGLLKFAKITDKIAWICSNFENATKDIEKKEGE